MRDYDPCLPLIAIHVPKTAGTSVRDLYKAWFGQGLIPHYRTPGNLPKKHDLAKLHSSKTPVVVYGHFNQLREFGIEAYYPEVEQFVTILRDPFDRAVSRYFYVKGRSSAPIEQLTCEKELKEVLLNQLPKWGMCCHFPKEMTMDNYKEIVESRFIEIGIMEHFDESLRRISIKLDKKFEPQSVPVLNVSRKAFDTPEHLREEFVEKHPLEYAIYNHARSAYE